MKYILNTIIIAFVLMTSCAKDKGNYDYKPINEVTIDSIYSSYSAVREENFSINPTILRSIKEDDSNLSYFWIINNDTIARDKNLNITMPSSVPYGQNNACFMVRDNNTGMEYNQLFTITVTSPFSYGYYFLTERPDTKTEIAYMGVQNNPNNNFLYTTSVSGVDMGSKPISISAKYGYISNLQDYFWTINIVSNVGETPIIKTENATFLPISTFNNQSFAEQGKGYTLNPECLIADRRSNVFVISNGQFISVVSGLLYRPARHNQTYSWAYPAYSGSGGSFMWVYDKLTNKYYVISPAKDDPASGILGDANAYDNVDPITDCPDMTGHIILGTQSSYQSASGQDKLTVVTANDLGINFITMGRVYATGATLYDGTETLQTTGQTADTKAVLVKSNDWYFTFGNKIVTTPVLLPVLSDFLTLPSDLGEVTAMNCSAAGSKLIVTMYDENSSDEYKGSLVKIDIQTKEVQVFKHVMNKCVSILSANTDGYGWGEGDGE